MIHVFGCLESIPLTLSSSVGGGGGGGIQRAGVTCTVSFSVSFWY